MKISIYNHNPNHLLLTTHLQIFLLNNHKWYYSQHNYKMKLKKNQNKKLKNKKGEVYWWSLFVFFLLFWSIWGGDSEKRSPPTWMWGQAGTWLGLTSKRRCNRRHETPSNEKEKKGKSRSSFAIGFFLYLIWLLNRSPRGLPLSLDSIGFRWSLCLFANGQDCDVAGRIRHEHATIFGGAQSSNLTGHAVGGHRSRFIPSPRGVPHVHLAVEASRQQSFWLLVKPRVVPVKRGRSRWDTAENRERERNQEGGEQYTCDTEWVCLFKIWRSKVAPFLVPSKEATDPLPSPKAKDFPSWDTSIEFKKGGLMICGCPPCCVRSTVKKKKRRRRRTQHEGWNQAQAEKSPNRDHTSVHRLNDCPLEEIPADELVVQTTRKHFVGLALAKPHRGANLPQISLKSIQNINSTKISGREFFFFLKREG